MPKAKVRSVVKSRIKKTGSGKYKMMKAGTKHLLQQKSKNKKLGQGKVVLVSPHRLKSIKRAMPGF